MLQQLSSYFHSQQQFQCVSILIDCLRRHYGENLNSVAIFGSYARREARLNSDLDLYIVLKNAPYPSRNKVNRDFTESVENKLIAILEELRSTGICMDISPVIFSIEQASCFNPLYYDMTEHAFIIQDENDFLKEKIEATREMMKKNGSKKVIVGGHWYWIAKPAPKFEEIISYEI